MQYLVKIVEGDFVPPKIHFTINHFLILSPVTIKDVFQFYIHSKKLNYSNRIQGNTKQILESLLRLLPSHVSA